MRNYFYNQLAICNICFNTYIICLFLDSEVESYLMYQHSNNVIKFKYKNYLNRDVH